MSNRNEQRRQVLRTYRFQNHPFRIVEATLKDENHDFCAKPAVGWIKFKRLHDLPRRPQIALRGVRLGARRYDFEVVRRNGVVAIEQGAGLIESSQAAESAPNICPN